MLFENTIFKVKYNVFLGISYIMPMYNTLKNVLNDTFIIYLCI